ncbi:MAG: hypothetical protein U0263_09685 [Polyangiaceae bacterium]
MTFLDFPRSTNTVMVYSSPKVRCRASVTVPIPAVLVTEARSGAELVLPGGVVGFDADRGVGRHEEPAESADAHHHHGGIGLDVARLDEAKPGARGGDHEGRQAGDDAVDHVLVEEHRELGQRIHRADDGLLVELVDAPLVVDELVELRELLGERARGTARLLDIDVERAAGAREQGQDARQQQQQLGGLRALDGSHAQDHLAAAGGGRLAVGELEHRLEQVLERRPGGGAVR